MIILVDRTRSFKNKAIRMGEEIMKKSKVDPKWIRHEALHTTNLLLESIEEHLAKHWYYQSKINPKFNQEIDKAIAALAEAYQSGGNEKNEVKKKIKMTKK